MLRNPDVALPASIFKVMLTALILYALPCHAADQSIEGARGIVATVDQASGRYVRSFALEETGTPWHARMRGDGVTEIAGGLNEGVVTLPARFTQQTLMAFDLGVNAAWESWGTALTGLQGNHRPSNDADTGLRYLGYWTDNGAAYWYNYEPGLPAPMIASAHTDHGALRTAYVFAYSRGAED
ncbi:MAG: hypothetical protein ACYDAH_02275 [Steroidobacteraceae bacterium]